MKPEEYSINKERVKPKKQQATCALCVVFWLIVVLVLAILYFALFKPRDPEVQVQSIELASLSSFPARGPITCVNMSLDILVLVNNPNRGVFYYSVSSAYLYHDGLQVGSASLPRGQLDEQEARNLCVTGLSVGLYLYADMAGGLLSLSATFVLSGHVSVLSVFARHATSASNCTLTISLAARSIQNYICDDGIAFN